MQKKSYKVTESSQKERIDLFLSKELNFSRSHAKKLCDEGCVLINGTVVKANRVLKGNETVEVDFPVEKCLDAVPEDIPINIVYEDDDLAVIDKPQGMTVHAGSGTHGNTLVNALLFKLDHLSGINGVIRPGIVHRIDKNTSGLLVVAKNDLSHVALSKQLQDKTCKRIYVALLEGVVKDDSGVIETQIGRSPKDRKKMAVVAHGRTAITEYKVLTRYENYTLCEFSLKTGRTHQIRVHAKYLGHAVVGDKEYGHKNQKFNLDGQLLHAKRLIFIHPTTNKEMIFDSEIPDYFKEVLKKIESTKR